jgi:hypothetical protein
VSSSDLNFIKLDDQAQFVRLKTFNHRDSNRKQRIKETTGDVTNSIEGSDDCDFERASSLNDI